jgi:hypothetical protein
MATKPTPTIAELPSDDDLFAPLRQSLNAGAMVQWINADLVNRADCDVRKSVVFYDADRVFMMALGTSVTPGMFRDRLDSLPNAIAAAYRIGVRYYSIGVK